MENHALEPTIVLGVNTSCCASCPKKLKKALLKIQGVYSVTLNPEMKQVSVTGKVDPMMLIKAIAKMGKTAELLSYEKEPKDEDSQSETGSNTEETDKEKCPEENQIGKNRKKKSGDHPKKSGSKKKIEDHKIEDYEPIKISEEICRDPYCKIHKRRPIITNTVPSWDSEDHPHHTQRFFRGANPLFHQRNPFNGYNTRMPPRMPMPSRGFGLYSGRAMPGFDGFTYYGDGSASGCNTM